MLECPDTGRKLHRPINLKVKHEFKMKAKLTEPFALLDQVWTSKLTDTSFGKCCVLCGSSTDLEMHHLRSIRDVRVKMKTGNSSYRMWIGAVKRKQIPLCSYHHHLYHSGELNPFDLR